MSDSTGRKFHIPNWYPPYLERHRIYELFNELGTELVLQQPADHVLFLRQILYNASISKDVPRVLIIAPPQVDVYEFAQKLHDVCKAFVITERNLLNRITQSPRRPKPKRIIRCLQETLRTENTYKTGWILADFPRQWREAKMMLQYGILPTHVFQLIPKFSPSLTDLNYKKMPPNWDSYRRELLGLKELFRHNLKEIYMGDKEQQEIIHECIEILNIRKRYHAPIIPRIVLLGPRGCGRKTQAKFIADKFNLVHIDFEKILMENWLQCSYLSILLRATKDKLGEYSVLLTTVVHKRVLEKDCLEHGWILTGFPNNVDDMKHLNMIDTPPNRIIFMEANLNTCRDRVIHRKVDVFKGMPLYFHDLIQGDQVQQDEKKQHPRDREEVIKNELNYYCEHYNALRKYCGSSAYVVDANQPIQWVYECISSILMQPMNEVEIKCFCYDEQDKSTKSISLADTDSGSCHCEDNKLKDQGSDPSQKSVIHIT